MKKTINRLAFLIVILSFLFSCTGCELISSFLFGPTTGPMYGHTTPIKYLVTTDDIEYEYGEEITVELLFTTDICTKEAKDGNTYCVKILESPYYEIIGDNEVYTDGSENTEVIEGRLSHHFYWYRVVFKVRINEPSGREGDIGLAIKCVTDNWLSDSLTEDPFYYSGDPEYPYNAGIHFYLESQLIRFIEYQSAW